MLKQNIFRLPCRAFISFRNDRSPGFTLSEILITLVLMGTVMALTIPTMTQKTNKNAYVAELKKTYGMLDTATNQIMSNNAGTLINAFTWCGDTSSRYGTILEYNKTCGAGSVIGNCWPSSTSKLSGGAAVEGFNANGGYEGAVLADGTFLLFWLNSATCVVTGVSLNLPYSTSTQTYKCGSIFVDINGFRGPNTFGRDQFVFMLGANGLYPGGDPHTIYNDLTVECSAAQAAKNGYGCAAKVLNEGAMNY